MRIVHLAALGPTGTARSLSLLAPALAALGDEQSVVNVGPPEPFAADLSAAGVPVRPLRFRAGLDLARGRELRRLVAEWRPDVVHVWGNRAAAFANWLRLPGVDRRPVPFVVSDVVSPGRLAARTRAAARVVQDSPLLLAGPAAVPARAADFGLPAETRLIVTVTDFVYHTDPSAAITAFDILKHTQPDAHLLMIGDGPGRAKTERLNDKIAFDDNRVHFVGVRRDVPAILAAADVVLISHRDGKRTVAAEAVAAGRPVVAYNTPALASVLRDGENALLVPPGEPPLLAKGLFQVLSEPALAARLSGGPRTVPGAISPATAAREWQAIYRTAAG